MNVSKLSIVAALGGLALSSIATSARADFLLQSQNLTFDNTKQMAEFTLKFNQAPDFSTLDSIGRPANSFQVEFNGNYDPSSNSKFIDSLTSVVRGDEIHVAGTVPIRLPDGDGGANSGGWGPIIDTVPYSLLGDTISFTVPTKDLGWTGHNYQYQVQSLQFGKQSANQMVTMVPTPAAFTSGLAGLFLVAGISFAVRRKSA